MNRAMELSVTNECQTILNAPEAQRATVLSRYEVFKQCVEPMLAAMLLVVSGPLIAVILMAVRLSSRGGAIYSQTRLGLHGRRFTIYKIRTMYRDCERVSGAVWSGPGDPRVTPVGRLLRWAHLDELPQLVNVVQGEMGFVGPRPERPEISAQLEHCLPEHRDRLLVRPGLTGLAQVLQGPDTCLDSVRTKLKYDLYYVENQGPRLDFRIALGTVCYLARVPVPLLARLLRFPHFDFAQPHSSTEVERIAVSSRVQANYVN